MSKFSISAKALANQMAQQLDKMDKNPDGKISSKVWNDIFHAQEKSGKEIKSFITVENAEKSILAYLKRNEKKVGKQIDLGQKWLDSLNGVEDNESGKELEPKDGGTVEEVVIVSQKRPQHLILSNQAPNFDTEINLQEVKFPQITSADVSDSAEPISLEEIAPYIYSKNLLTEFKEPDFNIEYIIPENMLELGITDKEFVSSQNNDPSVLKKSWAHVKTLSNAFYEKVINISKSLKCNADDLMALMASESSLCSTIRNRIGAVGLIQFLPSTAKRLGTTCQKLRNMSPVEQLDYVYKFLDNAKTAAGFKSDDHIDAGTLYAFTFLPGRANRSVLTVKGEDYYRQNKGLDYNNDGKITKEDLSSVLESKKA